MLLLFIFLIIFCVGSFIKKHNRQNVADQGALEPIPVDTIKQDTTPIDDDTLAASPKWLRSMVSHNPEATDYAKDYGNRDNYIGKPIKITKKDKFNGTYLFFQWDKRWGYDPLGKETIAYGGCGPTCLSMAYMSLTDDTSMNPRKISEFAYARGYYTKNGTSWDFWTDGAQELGLSSEQLGLDETRMKSALDSGGYIICSVGPGDFTSQGHYILIRGYDENGFYINDPNHVITSSKQWSYDRLQPQIKNLWAIYK